MNCPNGDHCQFAHTQLETMFHPSVFRTHLCYRHEQNEGQCRFGKFCTHAHGVENLRSGQNEWIMNQRPYGMDEDLLEDHNDDLNHIVQANNQVCCLFPAEKLLYFVRHAH